MPLYVSSFFQGLVFWYAIEKVFMVHIGFTPTTIAASIIVVCIVGIALDVPSGILADRWSRKAVLVAATTALALSSLLLGLSHSVLEYVLAGVLFATYSSLHSGVFDAMIYDTLIQERGSRDGYEKYLGYSSVFNGVALVIGSLVGGLIGTRISLTADYLLSIPGGVLATVSLLMFREPKLHLQHRDAQVLEHTQQTFKAVFQRGPVVWIVVTILLTTVVFDFMLEVDQLWPLALHLKLVLFGPFNALLLLGYSIGGPLAVVLLRNRAYLIGASLAGGLAVIGLTVPSMPVVAVAEFVTVSVFVALYTIGLGKLHDTLPSGLRSGSSSTASMLSSALFIPLVFAFGYITEHYSVFAAARLLIPLALGGVLGVILITGRGPSPHNKALYPESKKIPNPIAP